MKERHLLSSRDQRVRRWQSKNSDGEEGERLVEIKDEGVLVQRGRFRFVPNKGIKPQGEIISEQWGHSRTTPSARQLGPIRKRWPVAVDCGLSPTGHSSNEDNGGQSTRRRRNKERLGRSSRFSIQSRKRYTPLSFPSLWTLVSNI